MMRHWLIVLSMTLAILGRADSSLAAKLKPKPVRAALEKRYAELADAYFRHDLDAALRIKAKDFQAISPTGQVMDAETMAGYVRGSFATVETTFVLTNEIETIDLHGDKAAAEVHQHWVRRQKKAGAVRQMDTQAHQRETWILRDGQWLLWRVDHVKPGPWFVDGKQVDPSKPYDPNAPPYQEPKR